MACKRDRIIDFLQSQGVVVNIGKNKAQGNKGFFKAINSKYRIDIAKGLDDEAVIRVLVHEFIHFIHYKYDKSLSSFDFLINDINDDIVEELLKITVDSINKTDVKPLMDSCSELKREIRQLTESIKSYYPDFKLSLPCKEIESKLNNNLKYLLKYDRVKVIENFKIKFYDICKISNYNLSEDILLYLKLKSKQRRLRRITSKISRLNRYYNKPSELLARSFEKFMFDEDYVKQNAPILHKKYKTLLNNNEIPLLCKFVELIN